MTDPRLPLQEKIYQLLVPALTGIATVRDGGDATSSPLPLVMIGEDDIQDDGTKDDFFTGDIVHTFHVFTDGQKDAGTKANKVIQQIIYALFHQNPPALAGGNSPYDCMVETGEVFRDPEYPVWHGVMRLRFSI